MNAENFCPQSYADLLEEIEQLKAKAEETRLQEMAAVIVDIQHKIEIYKISAKDLGFSESKTSAKRKAPKKVKEVSPPKYKNSDETNTWSGKGNRPQWVKDELDSGKNLEDLLIDTKQSPSKADNPE